MKPASNSTHPDLPDEDSETIQRSHVVYFIKRPSPKGRATFAIIRKVTNPKGKVLEQKTIEHERLNALNAQLKTGTIDTTSIEKHVEQLRDQLNAEQEKIERGSWVASEANLKLLNEYWSKRYGDTEIVSPERELYALKRAVDDLGPIPILGDPKKIRAAIKAGNPDPNAQRRYLGKVRSIRNYFGVKEEILLPEERAPECRYLTEPEFLKVLNYVEDELHRTLFNVLFYTGVRVGEAMYLNSECVHDRTISVSRQIRNNGEVGKRKNKKPYIGIVLPNGEAELNKWVNRRDRDHVRRDELAKIIKAACKKAFPNQPRKWLTAHDLRHCFAIMLLTKHHMNISTVARLIGDSVTTTEKHYAGFIRNDDFINSVLAITS